MPQGQRLSIKQQREAQNLVEGSMRLEKKAAQLMNQNEFDNRLQQLLEGFY